MRKRAIISVSDKRGVVEFAQALVRLDFEIVSTGGTFQALREAGVDAINVSDVTHYPECLDGRVKTLHPKIHAGILAIRDNAEHMETLKRLDVEPIDLVIINLYPFGQTIAKENATLEEAIENIDIGGPTMLRAAAKNYRDVTVVVEPSDYDLVLEEMHSRGHVSDETRFRLAAKVFSHTAKYDALIANYLGQKAGREDFPEDMTLTFEKVQEMVYGENPHQRAAFYRDPADARMGLAQARQLHGKTLSYNNISDANGALELLREFQEPCVVAVKHGVPCGVGVGQSVHEAYMKAYEGDPVSIFGGVVACNEEVDGRTAHEMDKIFLELIIAPSFSEEAIGILQRKKNIRLLSLAKTNPGDVNSSMEMKKVMGGLLIQDSNTKLMETEGIRVVTKEKPDDLQMKDLVMALKVVKHTKSNGIVLVKAGKVLGIGSVQTNRVDEAHIAIQKAGEEATGAVMASEAFFPFSDCVETANKAGIKAIVQPGGSIRDEESIEACNRYGIAMVFTGMRHFKH